MLVVLAAVPASTSVTINEVAKLDEPDTRNFGWSSDVSVSVGIVGAPESSEGASESGAAYVYRYAATGWTGTKVLPTDGPQENSKFGQAVGAADNLAVVGARQNGGKAYVFRWNGSSWNGTKLLSSDRQNGDGFGRAVAADDASGTETVVVGAPGDNTDTGAVYVYRYDGASWNETKITASDGEAIDEFGRQVALDGDLMAVAVPGDNTSCRFSGSAYVYRWDGSTWNETKIDYDCTRDDGFGHSIDVSGDRVVVGAPGAGGAAYVFTWDTSTWTQTKLDNPIGADGGTSDAGGNFGTSVGISGDNVVVGADDDNPNGSLSGSAFGFRWNESEWSEGRMLPSDGTSFQDFGGGASIHGTTALVGARDAEGLGGWAYVFDVSQIPMPQTLYVDADNTSGPQDGTSWSTAYPDLQDALAEAEGVDEIWMADGTYHPTDDLDETVSFIVSGAQNGLQIYGGFVGTETERSERDVAGNPPAVLDGVLLRSSLGTVNSDRVIVLDGTTGGTIGPSTVLDGVTITGGKGGMYCNGSGSGNACSPTLRALTFTDNFDEGSTVEGAALHNDGSNDGASHPTIEDAIFTNNDTGGDGGAIYNNATFEGASSPTITNATFEGNTAADGGAIYNDGSNGMSSPTITNATFQGNSSSAFAGAVYNDGSDGGVSSPTITTARFAENEASRGGAIYNDGTFAGTSSPTLTNAVVADNTAQYGGAPSTTMAPSRGRAAQRFAAPPLAPTRQPLMEEPFTT